MRGRPIVVAGSSSRAGKTALAETVLRSLPGSKIAVKFTTTDDVFERCPRGTTCIVCDIDVPFKVIRDDTTLIEGGTDTARLREATHGPVLWTISKKASAGLAWSATERFIEDMEPQARVVVEGSTVSTLCDPSFLFFVVHPFLSPERWKEGSRDLLARADVVVINRPTGETREPKAEVMEAVRAAHPRDLRIADAAVPLATWAADVASRLENDAG